MSGLNVSQVPFSSNVSIERSNSRERFLDFCREPERAAFSLRTVSIDVRFFFLSSVPSMCPRRSFILVASLFARDGVALRVARRELKADSSFDDVIKFARARGELGGDVLSP